jgi:hypothetical protein
MHADTNNQFKSIHKPTVRLRLSKSGGRMDITLMSFLEVSATIHSSTTLLLQKFYTCYHYFTM